MLLHTHTYNNNNSLVLSVSPSLLCRPPYSCLSRPTNLSKSLHFPTNPTCYSHILQHTSSLPTSPILDSSRLASLLQSTTRLKHVKLIHSFILKSHETYSLVFLYNNLINAYLAFGDLLDARKVFDGMPHTTRNVISWTAMLNAYFKFGLQNQALVLFHEFLKTDITPNGTTFVCLLNLCGKRLDYELGRQVHACIIKAGFNHLILDSALLYFYAQCGEFLSAFQVFDAMKHRDVVSWTTLITCCSQQGYGHKAFSLFSQMLLEDYLPNEHTVCSILKACAEEKALRFGRQLHVLALKKVIRNDVYIGTSLVDMYASCAQILESRKVFDRMKRRNTVTWTSIIAGCARNGRGYDALNLFRLMKRRKIVANNFTMVSILRACGSITALMTGKEVHAQVLKMSAQNNIYVGSTLVWLYCKCGEYTLASKVLQRMPMRDVVSWTAMISGCAHLGHEFEALGFLKKMFGEGVEPNPFTYSSILKACASLEAIEHGKLIHSSLNKSPAFSNNVYVGSALINMYAKCGYVSEAFRVFSNMPERNLVSWRSMIVGYARNGHCRDALKLIYQMQAEGMEVDDYIVTSVLSACGDVEWNLELPYEQFLKLS
ncbi:pentatricopeptide repeat-containing protein At4g18520, chloroplastic-like [Silene latifolia]|uniref:pentatricopeptide repeat-containing protein At4g18520, chloroplastic-like n=1 Tax=Silene latifolia TaxID=37657 RepID=UPI003D783BB9